MIIYAGIGSRETPPEILQYFEQLATWFTLQNFMFRSGGAPGADTAFFKGCQAVRGQREIFTAWDSASHPEWFEHAAKFHPAWGRCSDYAKALHARNSPIVLGERLDDPVDFITCWTPGGQVKGGTGQALRIASAESIPIFNFGRSGAEAELRAFLSTRGVAA